MKTREERLKTKAASLLLTDPAILPYQHTLLTKTLKQGCFINVSVQSIAWSPVTDSLSFLPLPVISLSLEFLILPSVALLHV